jgi:hypothetical protein
MAATNKYVDIIALRMELTVKGVLRDSGRRRNGQILWELTETRLKFCARKIRV